MGFKLNNYIGFLDYLEYWSDSIVDLGLWIAELYKEYDPILINPIRNLKSEI